jgi:hypothetical protein
MYVNCEADFEFYSKERIHAKVQEGVHEVSIGYRGYIELFSLQEIGKGSDQLYRV